MRDGSVLPDVDVEPVRVKVLGHHRALRDDPVYLWQLTLRKRLPQRSGQHPLGRGLLWLGCEYQLTTSLDASSSVIFLPTSLLLHSSVLLSGSLVTPGTTRGILGNVLVMMSLGGFL